MPEKVSVMARAIALSANVDETVRGPEFTVGRGEKKDEDPIWVRGAGRFVQHVWGLGASPRPLWRGESRGETGNLWIALWKSC